MKLSEQTVGMVLMAMAALLLPVADSLSKVLAQTYQPLQIVWARNLFHLVIFAPWAILSLRNTRLSVTSWPLHLIRAVTFVSMSFFYVTALGEIPLVDAQSLVFVFPLIVIALSAIFLGETVTLKIWLAGGMGLVGAVIVLGPGGVSDFRGAGFAVLAAASTAVYMLLNRKLAPDGVAVLMILPPLFGTLVLPLILPPIWVQPNLNDWALMAATGAVFAMAHGLIILAFARVVANRLAPLTYFQVVSGVGLGFFVFGDWPLPQVWLGLGLIVLAGLIVQSRET